MPQKYVMRISTGLPFGGNQVPGRMVPSQSTYTLDADNRIEVHQIDVEALQQIGFVLVAQGDGNCPGAFDRTSHSLAGDVTSAAPGAPIHSAACNGITQLTGNVTAGPGSGSQAA